MLDPNGCVLTWNEGAQRLKQYQASEIIGHHFSQFYMEEDIKNGKPPRELTIAQQHGAVEDEGWRLRKDGSKFWASVVITSIYDSERRLLGFAKVTRDLTERKNAEQTVIDAYKESARLKSEVGSGSCLSALGVVGGRIYKFLNTNMVSSRV